MYKRVEADLVGYLIGRYKKWRAAAIHSIIDRLSIRLQLHSLKHVGKSCLGGGNCGCQSILKPPGKSPATGLMTRFLHKRTKRSTSCWFSSLTTCPADGGSVEVMWEVTYSGEMRQGR